MEKQKKSIGQLDDLFAKRAKKQIDAELNAAYQDINNAVNRFEKCIMGHQSWRTNAIRGLIIRDGMHEEAIRDYYFMDGLTEEGVRKQLYDARHRALSLEFVAKVEDLQEQVNDLASDVDSMG